MLELTETGLVGALPISTLVDSVPEDAGRGMTSTFSMKLTRLPDFESESTPECDPTGSQHGIE
jgi:hypothetical protein